MPPHAEALCGSGTEKARALLPWVKIDDNAPHHSKQLRAGPAACWLWVCGLAYCQKHNTDGFIPAQAVPFLGVANPLKLAGVLGIVGLWHAEAHGWRVHDYLTWNDSAEQRRGKTEQKTARQQKWRRDASGRRVDASRSHGVDASTARLGPVSVDTTPPPTPQPTPTPPPKKKNLDHALRASFDALWEVYPRKVGKEAAFTEFAKIAPDGPLVAVMVGAVERQRQSPQWLRDGGQFIPHPRTWLKQGRWQDDVDLAEPIAKPMTEFERERHERHQRAIAQQIEYAKRREQAS